MITIYYDFQKTQQIQTDAYTRTVKQVQDYIPLRQYIRRALNDRDHDYRIYVQNRTLAEWLRDLRDYPATLVHWEEIAINDHIGVRPEVDNTIAKTVEELASDYINPKDTDSIFATAQTDPIKIIPPILTIEGYLLANQETTLQIVIVNSNLFPIYTVRLVVSGLQVTVEWPSIEAGSSASHEVLAPATREKGDVQIVDYVCTYESSNRSRQFNDYVKLPIRRLQRNEVDALFEDML